MAREKIEIDLAEVERLAGLGLTQADIAAFIGVSEDTITRRKKDFADFADALKKGISKQKETLGKKLYELAENGDLGALIWIEKTRFGYSDKLQTESRVIIRLEDESE